MGFFKTSEEKQDKEDRKIKKFLEKYNIGDLEDLEAEDREAVKRIAVSLSGTGLMSTGMALSLQGKPYEVLPVYYLEAIMQQSFMIYRQLVKLNKK
uniref:Uncharacterized protein n=1 Tax=Firmicutes phage HS10 TaxID=3056392 RepID=A0AA49X4Z9_9VIRU|nr:MAG: hypothetical protein [Firmicutes phage HS10]